MKNKTIFIGLGILAVAGLGFYLWNKRKGETKSSADGDYSESESSANGSKSYNPLPSPSSDKVTIDKIKNSIKVLGKDAKINKLILQDISNFSKNLKDTNIAKNVISFTNSFSKGGNTTGTLESQNLIANILKFLSQY
jgi:hypothetical protein